MTAMAHNHPRMRLHYRRSGTGASVVLVHAGFLNHQMWSETHDALSPNYDVISYDVRGAGRSTRDDVDHAPSDDLHGLLDELDINRAALIGLSMGARIAFELMATAPDRVTSAVLCSLALPEFVNSDCNGMLPRFVDALTDGHVDTATRLFTQMWFDGRRTQSTVDPARRSQFGVLVDLTFATTFIHQRWRTLEELGPVENIQTPTLFIAGRDDWPDIHRTVEALNARMPNSTAMSIDNAAHTLNIDQPDELHRTLGRFLSAHG